MSELELRVMDLCRELDRAREELGYLVDRAEPDPDIGAGFQRIRVSDQELELLRRIARPT